MKEDLLIIYQFDKKIIQEILWLYVIKNKSIENIAKKMMLPKHAVKQTILRYSTYFYKDDKKFY